MNLYYHTIAEKNSKYLLKKYKGYEGLKGVPIALRLKTESRSHTETSHSCKS